MAAPPASEGRAPGPVIRPLLRLGAAVLLVVAGGCGILPGAGGPGPLGSDASPYEQGLEQLARGAFSTADSAFRAVVTECRSADEARVALLLLASLHQDPRNTDPRPDSAALMAARYLALEGIPEYGRRLAEGIYVRALDRGGDPGLRPDGSWPSAGGCRLRVVSDDGPLTLPVLEVTPYDLRLDSLRRVERALRARSARLEAELERIRRLLQQPDTAGPGGERHR